MWWEHGIIFLLLLDLVVVVVVVVVACWLLAGAVECSLSVGIALYKQTRN